MQETILNEKAIHSTALFDQAVVILQKKLATDPHNQQVLWQLIENTRQQGRLQEAARYCESLLQLAPEHTQARYLHAVLHETTPVMQSAEMQPVPFIRREDILNTKEQQQVWACIAQHQTEFKPSKVVSGNLDARKSQLMDLTDASLLRAIKSWFLPKVADVITTQLGYFAMPDLIFGKKELQLTLHGNQHYFKTHTDVSNKNYSDKPESEDTAIKSRKISFVYYLHSIPKMFTGGDLLFDTHLAENSYSKTHTRIMPQHNNLILFPSQYYHQVTPVSCAATDIMQGRFTLNGWFHAKTTD